MRTARRSGWWLVAIGILALVASLLSACTAQIGARSSATPGGPDTAAKQDQIPPPTPTTVPTVTPQPTATPRPTPPPPPTGVPYPPLITGKLILVSLSRQQIWTYSDGVYQFTNLVETGRPELPTPTGTFHVFLKKCSDQLWTSNTAPTTTHNANCTTHVGDGYQVVFNSPFPKGSPYWYYPTHINYALEFKDGGFYLHDAWWHVKFGPGGNVPHQLADGTWETGSHGCIGMKTSDAERLYAWAPDGTTVIVRANL